MKNYRFLLAALALFATGFLPLLAADNLIWSGTGTGTGTLSYAVVPHTGKSLSSSTAQPLLTYLNATSDTNSAVVKFYNAGPPTACNFTNLGTTLYVALSNTTNSATAFTNANGYSGLVLIYHKRTGVFDRRILGTATGGTNLVTTVATTNFVGDLVWPLAVAGSIPVGVGTKEINGAGIFCGEPGEPLVFEITGTTNSTINAACARYYP